MYDYILFFVRGGGGGVMIIVLIDIDKIYENYNVI